METKKLEALANRLLYIKERLDKEVSDIPNRILPLAEKDLDLMEQNSHTA